MLATGAGGIALEVGALTPGMIPGKELQSGKSGCVTNLKTTRDAKVGDTVTLSAAPPQPLPGIKTISHLSMPAFPGIKRSSTRAQRRRRKIESVR